jgi:hypothetical protein
MPHMSHEAHCPFRCKFPPPQCMDAQCKLPVARPRTQL